MNKKQSLFHIAKRDTLPWYKSFAIRGCAILLACIIFSQFASSPPVVTEGLAPATVVWNYIGELVFNMLVLVGSIKMSDRIIRELMGLG